MADESESVLALLKDIRTEQINARTDMVSMRSDIAAMRADISSMDTKLNVAAARANDVMAAQVKMQTSLTAILAMQEEHGRILVGRVRQELDALTRRVEVLEARKS